MKKNTMYFVGKTFFALFQTENDTLHDRMKFIPKGSTDKTMFFNWVQDEREKIEAAYNTKCIILKCDVI